MKLLIKFIRTTHAVTDAHPNYLHPYSRMVNKEFKNNKYPTIKVTNVDVVVNVTTLPAFVDVSLVTLV